MSLGDEINKALENVDQVTYGTRLGICKGSNTGIACPAYSSMTGTCKDCLCIMAIKAKLKSQACPRGKWR